MVNSSAPAESMPVPMPTSPNGIFDPPSALGRFREAEPVRRLAYPDGHVGWLVTGHALARAVLADPRFSMRMSWDREPVVHPVVTAEATERLKSEGDVTVSQIHAGSFLQMDPPKHTRFRRLLTGEFTVRRMRQLELRIERIVADHLDAMERTGPPVDVVQSFALPIPSLTICELLGVPYEERDAFQNFSATPENPDSSADDVAAAIQRFGDWVRKLVRHKRANPADDLLSRLTVGGELTDDELAGVTMLLVEAGHHTTSNMLALGTLALLSDSRRWEALRADPASIANAVEELLRYLSIIQWAVTRTALEDVQLADVLIKAGEGVTVSLSAANRDPDKFPEAEELDLTRRASGHLAFAHGIHQCLGQHLARLEMQIGFAGLIRRFPSLRLAVPAEEVPVHPRSMNIYGPYRLPVAW